METINNSHAWIAQALLRGNAMSGQEKQENTTQTVSGNVSPVWTKLVADRSTLEAFKAWSPDKQKEYVDSLNDAARRILNLTDYLNATFGKMSSASGTSAFASAAAAVAYQKISARMDARIIQDTRPPRDINSASASSFTLK